MIIDPYRYGSGGDPYWANVVLSLPFDGTDGSTTFTDVSTYARTVTAIGNAQIDTAIVKYGTGAGLFDGTGDRLSVPQSTDFDFGINPFTVECDVYRGTNGNLKPILYISRLANTAFYLLISAGGDLFCYIYSGGGTLISSGLGGLAVTANTWTHVAVTGDGTNFRLFTDGTLGATVGYSTPIATQGGTNPVYIGFDPDVGSREYQGSMDNFRVTKACRYTATFTPPAAAFPTF